MKKLSHRYLLPLALTGSLGLSAQKISSAKWTDLFSYNNVLHMRGDGSRIICATENGIFYLKTSSGETQKLSKANGLHQVKISAFDYDEKSKTGIVGYEDGSMDVITPDAVHYIYDIPIATGYSGNKRVNHISINGNLATVATGYGVSIFKVKEREFAETAFFKTGNLFENVFEAGIIAGKVYAATSKGLLSKSITEVDFPVYPTWQTALSSPHYQVDFGNDILAVATGSQVSFITETGINTISNTFSGINDIVIHDNNLTITTGSRIHRIDLNGNSLGATSVGEYCNTAIYAQNKIWGGTKWNGVKDEAEKSYKPQGPYNNKSSRINIFQDKLYIAGGGREAYNNPQNTNLGFYYFDGKEWKYPEIFLAEGGYWNVLEAIPNPSKPDEIWMVNYVFSPKKGVYRLKNLAIDKQFFGTGNEYLTRFTGIKFSPENDVYAAVNSLENNPINFGVVKFPAAGDNFSIIPMVNIGGSQRPEFYKNILAQAAPFYGNGGVGFFNYKNTTANSIKLLNKERGLPANGTVNVTFDKNGDLWIANREGLRILKDAEKAITDAEPSAEPVIITENNIGEELFRNNTVLDIAVDGGNHKWVSVDNGGVFYLSPNGEKTILKFDKNNSPLPDNSITDIEVDEKTGKVYFVSFNGVVVYQGDITEVGSNFGNVQVYPNPVITKQFSGEVTIRGLAERTNIRITDAAGYLIHSAVANGGVYKWNLQNQRGNRVASGVYMVLMTNEDGTDTKTTKIAVVN